MTKKMQLFGLFICTQSALHVSGNVFTPHQEHLTEFTASVYVELIGYKEISQKVTSSWSSITNYTNDAWTHKHQNNSKVKFD